MEKTPTFLFPQHQDKQRTSQTGLEKPLENNRPKGKSLDFVFKEATGFIHSAPFKAFQPTRYNEDNYSSPIPSFPQALRSNTITILSKYCDVRQRISRNRQSSAAETLHDLIKGGIRNLDWSLQSRNLHSKAFGTKKPETRQVEMKNWQTFASSQPQSIQLESLNAKPFLDLLSCKVFSVTSSRWGTETRK